MYFKLNLFSYSYNKCFYKKKKEIKLRFDRSIQGRGGLEAKCICKDDGNHSVPGPMNGIRKRQNDVGFLPTTKAQSRVKKKKKKSNSFHPMSRSCFKATINQNDQSLSHYTISNNIAPQSPPRYPSFSTVRSLTSSLVSIDLLGPHPLKKSLHSKKSFSKPFPLLSLSLSLSRYNNNFNHHHPQNRYSKPRFLFLSFLLSLSHF